MKQHKEITKQELIDILNEVDGNLEKITVIFNEKIYNLSGIVKLATNLVEKRKITYSDYNIVINGVSKVVQNYFL